MSEDKDQFNNSDDNRNKQPVQPTLEDKASNVQQPPQTQINNQKKPGIVKILTTALALIIGFIFGRNFPIPTFIGLMIYMSIILGIAINKRNHTKADVSSKSQSTKEITTIIALMILIASLLGLQLWSSKNTNRNKSVSQAKNPTEVARDAVTEAKKTNKLPSEVDKITTLNDITSSGNIIKYTYTIHDADTSQLSSASLEATVKPAACAESSVKSLLSQGVNLQYFYTVKESGDIYSFTLTRYSC